MTICAACDRAIPRHHNRHDGHEPGCPNNDWPNVDHVDCTCYLRYHEDCCPRPDCVASRKETVGD